MFIVYNTNTGLFGAYATRKEADGGTGMPVYGSVEELAKTPAKLDEMAKFYNRLTGADIKKFSDKASAARRIWDAAVAANEEFNEQNKTAPDEGTTPDRADPPAQPDAPEAAGEQTEQGEGNSQPDSEEQSVAVPVADKGKRGRKPGTGQFAGKTVFAKKQVNPRRAGTKGWHSYNIFLGKPEGVPYADYIAAGGRAVDLDWDIKHKFAEVK